MNVLTFEAVQAELANIEKKKKEIITLFPELNSIEEARNEQRAPINNEEYSLLLKNYQVKEEEASRYLQKIDNSDQLIRSLEDKFILPRIKNLIKENNSNLRSGVL